MNLQAIAKALTIALPLSLGFAGCSALDYEIAQSERSVQPIPSRLLGSMRARGMDPAAPVLVRLFKQESELEVWKADSTGRYALLKTYPICRWSGKLGPKKAKGDRQAPEGFYSVAYRQMNPHSRYYLSFNLGFPNRLEEALGYSGEALMIHGACSSAGCFAVTDEAAAEIYAVAREAFRGGQSAFQVQSFPFRMTAENLAIHRNDPNMPFWASLKTGFDHFEVTRQELRVAACGGQYVFNAANAEGLDPLAPCPALIVAPSVASAVARKQQDDTAKAAALGQSGALPRMSYVDGGMHPAFRAILQQSGPEKLASMTSERAPVSRPDAALADPYRPLGGVSRGS